MFKKLICNSFKITKAVQLAKQELGVDPDPTKHFGRFTKEAGEWNQQIDEFIAAVSPNDRELAIFLCVPLLDAIPASHKSGMRAMVRAWKMDNEIREDIAEMALQDLG